MRQCPNGSLKINYEVMLLNQTNTDNKNMNLAFKNLKHDNIKDVYKMQKLLTKNYPIIMK